MFATVKRILGLCLVLLLAGSTAFAQEARTSPLKDVKGTIDEVVRIAQNYQGDTQTDARRDRLREIINPRFDFKEMAQRSLGAHWKKVTTEQQKQFVDVFSDLLAKTYLARIETVKPGMVTIDSENVEFPKAVVKTSVNNKGDTFPIDYKLVNKDGEWKVYDVVIENIGLVANYRNEFAGIIRRETFDGLMKRLRAKANA